VSKIKRKILVIDEDKCNGCGECVPSCAEGAIVIEGGKAKLKAENLCDGLGACLGTCPMDAIKVIDADAEAFDEEAVAVELKKMASQKQPAVPTGCPSARMATLKSEPGQKSHIENWPIQLALLPIRAPFFSNSDLLIAADCTAFVCTDFNEELLKGNTLVIACPKLDDSNQYIEKLTSIFSENDINKVTVAHMEVPCCFGLIHIVETAMKNSKKDIPVNLVNISVKGQRL